MGYTYMCVCEYVINKIKIYFSKKKNKKEKQIYIKSS